MQLQRITKHTRPADRSQKWHVIDAEGERLGRLAAKIAGLLQGKHRPDYSRHQLSEDFVIVVNASRVGVSGNKRSQKLYRRHSGYLGSLRSRTLEEMLGRFPERVIELAVKGMLPRNRLGRRMLRRLKVYAGGAHPHEAQVRMGIGKPRGAPAASARSRGWHGEPAAAVADASEGPAAAVAEPVAEEDRPESARNGGGDASAAADRASSSERTSHEPEDGDGEVRG